MKHWRRKLGFGIFLIGLFLVLILVMQLSENSEDMKYATIFVIAMIGAVFIWFREINKERKRIAEDTYKRKHK